MYIYEDVGLSDCALVCVLGWEEGGGVVSGWVMFFLSVFDIGSASSRLFIVLGESARSVYMQACTYVPPPPPLFLSLSLTFTHAHTHTHTYTHTHTARARAHTHTRAHVYTHARARAHTHTHPHPHTHTLSLSLKHTHTHKHCDTLRGARTVLCDHCRYSF